MVSTDAESEPHNIFTPKQRRVLLGVMIPVVFSLFYDFGVKIIIFVFKLPLDRSLLFVVASNLPPL